MATLLLSSSVVVWAVPAHSRFPIVQSGVFFRQRNLPSPIGFVTQRSQRSQRDGRMDCQRGMVVARGSHRTHGFGKGHPNLILSHEATKAQTGNRPENRSVNHGLLGFLGWERTLLLRDLVLNPCVLRGQHLRVVFWNSEEAKPTGDGQVQWSHPKPQSGSSNRKSQIANQKSKIASVCLEPVFSDAHLDRNGHGEGEGVPHLAFH